MKKKASKRSSSMVGKLALRIALLVILCIIVLLAAVWFLRAPIAANILSNALQTPVTIQSINISSNSIEIHGFKIDNPRRSTIPQAFTADRILFRFNKLSDLTANVTTFQEIRVDQPVLGLELFNLSGSDNNWSRIINHINPKGDFEGSNDEKKVIIRLLDINSLHFNIYSHATHGNLNVSPMDIVLKNIGGDTGVPYSQVGNVIFREIIAHISKQVGLPELLKNLVQLPSNLSQFLPEGVPQGIKDQIDELIPWPFGKRH